MLDRFKAFWQGVVLAPIINLLIRLKVSPDVVTFVGTVGVAVGALAFYPHGHLFWGTIFITCFVFSDLVDGAMARKTGRTPGASLFGQFWDSTLDRIGDGAIFAGLALYFAGPGDSTLYLWLSLICLVMGAVTSYARAKAESIGLKAEVGIAERSDRLVAILVMTGLGDLFNFMFLCKLTLWALAIASTITVCQRVWVVRKQALAVDR
ncbi:phosphatidylinositol phosphate synthase [Nocardioides sp.]|jgi:CDP-diacylglycerol---glycerol-3-phosphate 3-phosphatidyltransferase|uniref:phosphatidylinositol phosphate synthase n=1 Tax=Nocardioides sp. TaxID=35761 RepID=UPI00260412ED|nr:CDP-alcohol phosphatidyltransferase family protein [Nocardioides sp.]